METQWKQQEQDMACQHRLEHEVFGDLGDPFQDCQGIGEPRLICLILRNCVRTLLGNPSYGTTCFMIASASRA